jgi:uncharacterized protein YuzE
MMVEFDPEAPATYVRLGDDTVTHTVDVVDAYCMVDVGQAGQPVGVEILDAPADIPEPAFESLAMSFPALDVRAARIALSGHAVAPA